MVGGGFAEVNSALISRVSTRSGAPGMFPSKIFV